MISEMFLNSFFVENLLFLCDSKLAFSENGIENNPAIVNGFCMIIHLHFSHSSFVFRARCDRLVEIPISAVHFVGKVEADRRGGERARQVAGQSQGEVHCLRSIRFR